MLLRDRLLAVFTDQTDSCFETKVDNLPPWVLKLCNSWISEPQTVAFTLEHSKLTLDPIRQFRLTLHEPPKEMAKDDITEVQDKWLATLVPDMSVATQELHDYFIDLAKRNQHVANAKIWRHPGHANSLIELYLSDNEKTHIILMAGPQTLTAIDILPRFHGKYRKNEIVRVSDLDEDGKLELWMANAFSFSHCRGDESDLERELDCTAKTADMGEIQNDTLSFFVKSEALPEFDLAKASSVQEPVVTGLVDEYRSCNRYLVVSVLASKLDLKFGDDGNVIGVVCKPHPLHPEQTLVALFHRLKDTEDKKGLVFAVIDVEQKRVHRLYRDSIQEDASTRISEYSLKIDTAPYNLAPGVRALGLRLNIGHSPRCADGGASGYLRLFVEEGQQLVPVLKDLPMNLWSITDGIGICGGANTEYTIDHVTLTITVLPAATEGWRDLEVTAHHRIETTSPLTGKPVKKMEKTQLLGTLRASGKVYKTHSIQYRIWP